MAGPSLVERIRGKRTSDIELPNTRGTVDDRLLADEDARSWNPLKRLGTRVQRLKQRMPKRTSRR